MKKREPTMEEIRRVAIMSANDDTVIVGGMAVSILAEIYGLSGTAPCMTKDADFLGGRLAIEESAEQLREFATRKYLASLDDAASPNSGKLAVEIDDRVEPVEIDFLFRIDGLSTDEVEQKAMTVEIDGKTVNVMHPVLLMESKINNLALYPAKRNEAGVNQARLAVAIVNAYLGQSAGKAGSERALLQVIERIARFALREPACFAYKLFRVDALAAIPAEKVAAREFRQRRWPQIEARVAARRAKFDKLWDRMARIRDPKGTRFRV